MKARYCYWTVADGDYAEMAKAVIQSARDVGVFKDFHVWTDRAIPGGTCHAAGQFDKWGCIFKLNFLREAVQKLNYEYFVWFDTDTFFVRNPGDVLRVMHDSPLHIALESDVCCAKNVRPDWWGCPNETFAQLMRARGVRSRSIYNVNGGLFIVHRDAIETVSRLCFDFFQFCQSQGYTFVDEPLLAYAMQMLCGDPSLHTVRTTSDLWASDWTGCCRDILPNGDPWWFVDYFTEDKIQVNPAIVHAMRSKSALIAKAAEISSGETPCVPAEMKIELALRRLHP